MNPSLAVYTVAAASGWMFGDPPGQAASLATGNQQTPNPGSAAWQTAGQLGNTGSFGWFLSANDSSFPPLSAGITVGGWFNCQFLGSQQVVQQTVYHVQAQQPYCPLTLMTLTTSSRPRVRPAAGCQRAPELHHLLRRHGHQPQHLRHLGPARPVLVQRHGHDDHHVVDSVAERRRGRESLRLRVHVVIVDLPDRQRRHGQRGGGATASIQHSGNLSASHIQVFPYVLPYYRIMDHYWAAVTRFGLLPAPGGRPPGGARAPAAAPR